MDNLQTDAAAQQAQSPETVDGSVLAAAMLDAQNVQDIPTEMYTPAVNDFKPVEAPNKPTSGVLAMTYYKHPMGSCRYGFKNGKEAAFVNHIYATNDPAEIKELDEVAPHLQLMKATGYVNAQELVDPTLAYKNKIIREYLEKQRTGRLLATDPGNDRGNYVQPVGAGAASTRNAISADAAVSQALSADINSAVAQASASGEPTPFAIPGAGNKPSMEALLAKVRGK